MNEGYIKSYRSILENPIVCKDTDYFSVWNYLLLNATHKEQKAVFNGKSVFLQPGQLIIGRKKIAAFWNISESKVQRILKTFENEHQIEQQTGNKNRLITIVNWEKYQTTEHQTEQQVNNKRTTSEQQVNTNKNDKNDKNDKNERNITSAKMPKHKYGKYKNVLLTDEEVEKLKAQLPDYDKNLETFSQRLAMKNYKYKSHYLAMLNWFKDEQQQKTTSYDLKNIKAKVNNFD